MNQLIPQQIKDHPIEYSVLCLGLALSAVFYFYHANDPHLQRRIVYAAAAIYFLWSLYHHYRRGDLHVSIVIEYLVMALLGVVFLSSTLF